MSRTTARLLGACARQRGRRPALLAEVARRLAAAYGTTATLGNYRNPVTEIFYILLSAKTTDVLYRKAHARLRQAYPRLIDLAQANVEDVEQCVGVAGLGRKRSAQIVELAKRLLSDHEGRPVDRLRGYEAADAFRYLTSLPGVGPKSALCVMMYSLDMDVFPVDVNVQRIAERMGVLQRGLKHYQAQRRLPKSVPAGISRDLHIGMVIHGRRVCRPKKALCSECCIADLCKTGIRNKKSS